jgi:hypothetical protein
MGTDAPRSFRYVAVTLGGDFAIHRVPGTPPRHYLERAMYVALDPTRSLDPTRLAVAARHVPAFGTFVRLQPSADNPDRWPPNPVAAHMLRAAFDRRCDARGGLAVFGYHDRINRSYEPLTDEQIDQLRTLHAKAH